MKDRKPEVTSQKSVEPLAASVEVHIEELVLHGIAPADRYRIGEAVERELSRIFAEQGTPPTMAESREIEHVDGGSFHMTSPSRPKAIGSQVARSVYGGLAQ